LQYRTEPRADDVHKRCVRMFVCVCVCVCVGATMTSPGRAAQSALFGNASRPIEAPYARTFRERRSGTRGAWSVGRHRPECGSGRFTLRLWLYMHPHTTYRNAATVRLGRVPPHTEVGERKSECERRMCTRKGRVATEGALWERKAAYVIRKAVPGLIPPPTRRVPARIHIRGHPIPALGSTTGVTLVRRRVHDGARSAARVGDRNHARSWTNCPRRETRKKHPPGMHMCAHARARLCVCVCVQFARIVYHRLRQCGRCRRGRRSGRSETRG
jgi:hypothetical protein